MPSIELLADQSHLIPTLARWFEREWAGYYGPRGPGNPEADLQSACQRDRLPICLVALDADGRALGTATLKQRSISHHHLCPWIAALMVAPEHRCRGVGAELVAGMERTARRLGYHRLHMATNTAAGIIERRGWRAFDATSSAGGIVKVYALELRVAAASDPPQDER